MILYENTKAVWKICKLICTPSPGPGSATACSYNFKVNKALPRNYFYELMFLVNNQYLQSLGEKGIYNNCKVQELSLSGI
jgi:hypothetical protein